MKSCLYYGVLVALVTLTQGREKVDVQAEVNKITEKFEKLNKPSSQQIESFIENVRDSCRTNRTIEPEVMSNMSVCVGKLFNQTALTAEFEAAIPRGDLDDVFRSICLKWPNVKDCLKPGFELVDECWEKGDKITVALDSIVGFFCENDNSGAKIALFFAEGGLSCLETNGEAVRTCFNEHFDEESQNLCASAEQIHQCLTPLRKCKDVTPENLISSVVKQVAKAMDCPAWNEPLTGNAPSHSHLVTLPIFLMSGIAIILLEFCW